MLPAALAARLAPIAENFVRVLPQVSTNGLILFRDIPSSTTWKPEKFPWTAPLLAAFWADIDIRRTTGNVTYRPYLRTPDNEIIFDRGEAVVRRAFRNHFDFAASWMLIATWYEVLFYGTTRETIVRTILSLLIYFSKVERFGRASCS